jgi:hypothetical protein
VWYEHAAHVEKGEMATIFWRKIGGGKIQLKIGCIFLYNTKIRLRGTGHETAY